MLVFQHLLAMSFFTCRDNGYCDPLTLLFIQTGNHLPDVLTNLVQQFVCFNGTRVNLTVRKHQDGVLAFKVSGCTGKGLAYKFIKLN